MFRTLAGALIGRFGAKVVGAALMVGALSIIALILASISFEVSMIGTGMRAFAQAYLVLDSGIFMVVAIMMIGGGMIFRAVWRFGSSAIISLGVLLLIGAIIAPRLLGAFPYGHDSPGRIASLWGHIKQSATITDDLAQMANDQGSAFLSTPVSAGGHRYLALNRLGCSKASPAALVKKIEADLNPEFPIWVHGDSGSSVLTGSTVKLGLLPEIGNNPVTCRLLNDHCFALDAQPKHWLEGTAYHGIVRDRSGDLWLFQYGAYEAADGKEPNANQLANYPIADRMWRRMAKNIPDVFHDDFSEGCRSSPLGKPVGGSMGGGGSSGRW